MSLYLVDFHRLKQKLEKVKHVEQTLQSALFSSAREFYLKCKCTTDLVKAGVLLYVEISICKCYTEREILLKCTHESLHNPSFCFVPMLKSGQFSDRIFGSMCGKFVTT